MKTQNTLHTAPITLEFKIKRQKYQHNHKTDTLPGKKAN